MIFPQNFDFFSEFCLYSTILPLFHSFPQYWLFPRILTFLPELLFPQDSDFYLTILTFSQIFDFITQFWLFSTVLTFSQNSDFFPRILTLTRVNVYFLFVCMFRVSSREGSRLLFTQLHRHTSTPVRPVTSSCCFTAH